MAKAAYLTALKQGKDVVLDTTADSSAAKLTAKVQAMRDAGAQKIYADYATPGSLKTAISRAEMRAQQPGENYGRKVPTKIIKSSHKVISETWVRVAEAGVFDRQRLWSSAGPKGTPYTLIAEAKGGKITIHDQKAYDNFRNIK